MFNESVFIHLIYLCTLVVVLFNFWYLCLCFICSVIMKRINCTSGYIHGRSVISGVISQKFNHGTKSARLRVSQSHQQVSRHHFVSKNCPTNPYHCLQTISFKQHKYNSYRPTAIQKHTEQHSEVVDTKAENNWDTESMKGQVRKQMEWSRPLGGAVSVKSHGYSGYIEILDQTSAGVNGLNLVWISCWKQLFQQLLNMF